MGRGIGENLRLSKKIMKETLVIARKEEGSSDGVKCVCRMMQNIQTRRKH